MITESTLQGLLSNEDLSQSDKILCCLAFEPDTPMLVKSLKELAAHNGLPEIDKWNVLAQLIRLEKFAFKTAAGWEITSDGLAYVEALSGDIANRPHAVALTDENTYGVNSTRTLLLIEDDQHTLQLLKFIFGRAGYNVSTAEDGREALRIIDEEPAVDQIVMGLTLPYASGYQVIINAKQSPTWMRVPIIVLSGKALEMDVVRALNTGANDYVTKPFRPQELLARVRRLLATYEILGKGK